MRKKWLALALSLTMVAGCLTGCGGSDSTTSNTNTEFKLYTIGHNLKRIYNEINTKNN